MKTWILLALIIVIASSAVFSGLTLAAPGIFQAYAGISLDPDNAANSIVIHTNREDTNLINTYDSFSRIGFVSGNGNFLLESVPSLDKRDFYEFIKDSLDNISHLEREEINISIDIYSGNGKLIETLLYEKCQLDEYFVHAVDSLGKIQFIEGRDSIEIREVAKFQCLTFTISLDRFGTSPDENIIYQNGPDGPNEGELFYNSMTNTLQKYQNGTWIDISGKGGPSIQR